MRHSTQRRRWRWKARGWRRVAAGGVLLAAACQAGLPASPTDSNEPGAIAAAPPPFPIRRLRRLSSREYNNVVRDLLGDTSRPADAFIQDVFANGYDNGSAGLAVQSDQVVAYATAAEALAATAVQTALGTVLGGCDPAASGDSACLEAMLSSFASRAYRRPLTDTEKQRLRDVYSADAQTGGFNRGIQTILEVILQSPQFLYREELGPLPPPDAGAPPSGTTIRLTDEEVATELSFLVTGTVPDAELSAAVQEQHFRTTDDYRREALRLLSTPGAKDALRTFLHEWLGTDRLAGMTKDPVLYPTFTPAVAASMSAELDQFFDAALWTGAGSLRALFTTPQAFADPTLASLYGVAQTASGLQPVSLDPQIRPGILTRAGFLAVHAATDSSGPISRGVFLLRSIMCSPPPPPPPNIPPVPPATDPSVQNMTTRQRYAAHVRDSFCAGCHDRIDGIGFGFEEFDGVGAYRTTENGQPVDSSGTVLGTGEIDGAFQGAGALAVRLSGSRLLADCYARQAYRYAMGSVEGEGQDLTSLVSASSPDAPLTAALVAIVTGALFTERSFE